MANNVLDVLEKELGDFSLLDVGGDDLNVYIHKVTLLEGLIAQEGFEKIFLNDDTKFRKLMEFFLKTIEKFSDIRLSNYPIEPAVESEEIKIEYQKEVIMINVYASVSNISGTPILNTKLIEFPNFLKTMFKIWCDKDVRHNLSYSSPILANLAIDMENGIKILNSLPDFLNKIIDYYVEVLQYDCRPPEHIFSFFGNISQVDEGRRILMNRSNENFQTILKYKPHHGELLTSIKVALSNLTKNCCFLSDNHIWLMSEKVDILYHILEPLIGHEDTYSDEEILQLPNSLLARVFDVRDKKIEREQDTEIRHTLLQALYMLCSKRESREYMRKLNVYFILREYHKWETNDDNQTLTESIVNLLVQTEDEIDAHDLLELNSFPIKDGISNTNKSQLENTLPA